MAQNSSIHMTDTGETVAGRVGQSLRDYNARLDAGYVEKFGPHATAGASLEPQTPERWRYVSYARNGAANLSTLLPNVALNTNAPIEIRAHALRAAKDMIRDGLGLEDTRFFADLMQRHAALAIRAGAKGGGNAELALEAADVVASNAGHFKVFAGMDKSASEATKKGLRQAMADVYAQIAAAPKLPDTTRESALTSLMVMDMRRGRAIRSDAAKERGTFSERAQREIQRDADLDRRDAERAAEQAASKDKAYADLVLAMENFKKFQNG